MKGLERQPGPFPLAVTDAAFDPDVLGSLEDLFSGPQAWARHQDHFYRCWIAEVDGQLPEVFLTALRDQVAAVLGLELAGPVRVTAQRMQPGDGSDRHTDRPLAGYEAARLVVQLDRVEGGHFRAFDGARVWLDRPPVPNQAVAFELSPRSEHDVTACADTRRTVVFHFWHIGNPPDARERLDRSLGAMSFADLPDALDPVMEAAEARTPEATTHLAASVAWLLHRWGLPIDGVLGGYRRVITGEPGAGAERIARWLVGLHIDHFDRAGWEQLRREVAGEVLPPEARRWLE